MAKDEPKKSDAGKIITSALLGAAAGAAAVALSDKNNRKKISEKAEHMMSAAKGQMEHIRDEAKDAAEKMQKEGKAKLSESLGSVKQKLDGKN
jgi:gas vesicle protein